MIAVLILGRPLGMEGTSKIEVFNYTLLCIYNCTLRYVHVYTLHGQFTWFELVYAATYLATVATQRTKGLLGQRSV